MILFGFGIGIIVALLQSFGNFPVIQISFKIFYVSKALSDKCLRI